MGIRIMIHEANIAIIGMGYVGLPLVVEFGKPDSIIYDVKYVLQCHAVDGRL